jgi:uncharacterized protein YndB with AHSA1/START domain
VAAVHATTTIDAPPERVWAVLADLGTISRWNPGVLSSRGTSEARAGEGATRHCELPRGRYLDERAVEWREGQSFRIKIVASNLPLKSSSIRFAIAPAGEGTRVTVEPQYVLSGGLLGRLLDRIAVRRMYARGFRDLLAGLKYHVETGREIARKMPAPQSHEGPAQANR